MTITDSNGEHSVGPLLAGADTRRRVSASTDPDEHQAELAGAHDRTAFHEGFERVIAENVRRSSELMLDMLTMRETMAASAYLENRQVRERIVASLAEMDAGLQAIRTQVDAIAGQVSSLRHSLGSESTQFTEHQPGPAAASAAPVTPVATPADARADWNAPQVIDIIVHQVNKATVALSLQRHLGNLDAVAGVEAREFAEGVLRMQVTAHRPFTRDDLSSWTEGGPFTVLQMQPHIIELTLNGGA